MNFGAGELQERPRLGQGELRSPVARAERRVQIEGIATLGSGLTEQESDRQGLRRASVSQVLGLDRRHGI